MTLAPHCAAVSADDDSDDDDDAGDGGIDESFQIPSKDPEDCQRERNELFEKDSLIPPIRTHGEPRPGANGCREKWKQNLGQREEPPKRETGRARGDGTEGTSKFNFRPHSTSHRGKYE